MSKQWLGFKASHFGSRDWPFSEIEHCVIISQNLEGSRKVIMIKKTKKSQAKNL